MSALNVLEKSDPKEVRLQQALAQISVVNDITSPLVALNARLLFEIFVAGRQPDQQILGCLRMTKWIDEQAYSLAGKKMKKVIKMTLAIACDLFVAEAAERNVSKTDLLAALKSRDGIHLASKMDVNAVTFACIRIEQGLSSLSGAKRYAQAIQRAGSSAMTPRNTEAVAEIIGNMLEMRKYGVKTVLMTDGVSHEADACWVIRDARDVIKLSFKRGAPDAFMSRNLIGVELADAAQFADGPSLTMRKKRVVNLPTFSFQGFGADYQARMAFGLTDTGEFSASLYHGFLPIRPAFERAGEHAVAHYEMLRLVHTLHLFDLVVPAEVVERVSRMTREAAGECAEPTDTSFMRNLVIPRLRILGKRPDVVRALEEECERADDDMVRRSNRPLKRHEVICHPRRLPHGRRPSPHAVELAREYGITLADDETFVQTHFRGEGEDTVISTTHTK